MSYVYITDYVENPDIEKKVLGNSISKKINKDVKVTPLELPSLDSLLVAAILKVLASPTTVTAWLPLYEVVPAEIRLLFFVITQPTDGLCLVFPSIMSACNKARLMK